jgi:hypothetical protein
MVALCNSISQALASGTQGPISKELAILKDMFAVLCQHKRRLILRFEIRLKNYAQGMCPKMLQTISIGRNFKC